MEAPPAGQNKLADLKKRIKDFPNLPGVYLMKNSRGSILYVGKAKALRKRLPSYFVKTLLPKTRAMMAKVNHIHHIVTQTEAEALLLEDNLIKAHRPRYNSSFKDDKSFPYMRLGTDHPYPMVTVTRKPHRDKAEYYGPFPGVRSATLLGIVNRYFRIRHCKTASQFNEGRLCLDFYIHRCNGPCAEAIDKVAYSKEVERIRLLLSGRTGALLKELQPMMLEASDSQDYEKAARLRDQIAALEKMGQQQEAVQRPGLDQDVAVSLQEDGRCVLQILLVRDGKLSGRLQCVPVTEGPDLDADGGLSAFLSVFYQNKADLPKELVTNRPLRDADTLGSYMSIKKGSLVKIFSPQRGSRRHLVELALSNARDFLRMDAVREKKNSAAVMDLKRMLHLKNIPNHIEGFDIAHTQGVEAVGAMVHFLGGEPAKRFYRKFKIKTIEGIDDYAMMEEVVRRRYKRLLDEKQPLPDLVLIDGGLGHLRAVTEVLDDLGLGAHVDLVSLAKKEELIYKRGQDAPFRLPLERSGHRLLRYVRNEAHRFSNTFHGQRRAKKSIRSALDGIPGVGPKTRRRIMETFGSLEKFMLADESYAAKSLGMSTGHLKKVRDGLAKKRVSA